MVAPDPSIMQVNHGGMMIEHEGSRPCAGLRSIRRSAHLGCAALVFWILALMPQLGAAQDSTPADRMGRFMGYTVMCDCFHEDPEHLQALYYALLVDWRDSSYAEAASGFMREVADNAGRYQGEATFCWEICNHDMTTYLTDVMTMIDMETEPMSFIGNYTWAYENWFGDGTARAAEDIHDDDRALGRTSGAFCHSQPASPKCRQTTEVDD